MAGSGPEPMSRDSSPSTPLSRAGVFVAVVLAFNARDSLARVLQGIEAQTVRPARTIVVDNGSTDGTAEMVRSDFPWITLLPLPENAGVGAGHRRGWEEALRDDACEYIWSLEHDTFTDPGCLERLESESLRMTASGLRWGALNARLERSAEEAVHTVLQHSDPALGAIERRRITFNGIVVPRTVIEAIGFPRDDFFVGHEDWEYSERLRAAGYHVMYDEHAIVIHPTKGNRRHGVTPSVLRLYYSMRNGVYVDHSVRKLRGSALRWTGWTLAAIASTVARDDRKLARVSARVVALYDGLTGRLGKRDYWFLRG